MKKVHLLLMQALVIVDLLVAMGCDGVDNQPPTCTIIAPLNNDQFTINDIISVEVTAEDSDGTIAEVRLYVDNTIDSTTISVPCTFTISAGTLSLGSHTLRAVVKDDKGAARISNIVTIKVNVAVGMSFRGGIIAYVDSLGIHGLIAAPTDQSTGIQWDDGSYIVTGATLTAIGTGKANTTKIVQAHSSGSYSYAAKLCDDLELNDYDDWFLPSKDEFHQLYENRDLIGGFSNDRYWTSSEVSDNSAYCQSIEFGNTSQPTKDTPCRVRAVRVF